VARRPSAPLHLKVTQGDAQRLSFRPNFMSEAQRLTWCLIRVAPHSTSMRSLGVIGSLEHRGPGRNNDNLIPR
jgi:hypothetical protein